MTSDKQCRRILSTEDNEQHRVLTQDVVCLDNDCRMLERTPQEPDQDECLLLTNSETQPVIGRTDADEGNACHFHLPALLIEWSQ